MVPEQKIFARYPSADGGKNLPTLCESLLADQKSVWSACARGFEALQDGELRTVSANGFTTHLHWNPQRIVSTAAKVDAASIQARDCFLCLEHLPDAQQGILYRDQYLILCNPSPIFEKHFTVAQIQWTKMRCISTGSPPLSGGCFRQHTGRDGCQTGSEKGQADRA
jgi:hypothetical protein